MRPELAETNGRPLRPPWKIAVAASFTAEPVLDALAFWMRELGLEAAVEFAPYNQVFQELLHPGSLLARNRAGLNVILLRPADWLRFIPGADSTEIAREVLKRNAGEFLGGVQAAAARDGTPYIVALCPASPTATADPSRGTLLASIEKHILEELAALPGVSVIGPADLAAYPVADTYDPQRDCAGPYSVHALLLRRAGYAAGAADPCAQVPALQGDRAGLRQHALAGSRGRGRLQGRDSATLVPEPSAVRG